MVHGAFTASDTGMFVTSNPVYRWSLWAAPGVLALLGAALDARLSVAAYGLRWYQALVMVAALAAAAWWQVRHRTDAPRAVSNWRTALFVGLWQVAVVSVGFRQGGQALAFMMALALPALATGRHRLLGLGAAALALVLLWASQWPGTGLLHRLAQVVMHGHSIDFWQVQHMAVVRTLGEVAWWGPAAPGTAVRATLNAEPLWAGRVLQTWGIAPVGLMLALVTAAWVGLAQALGRAAVRPGTTTPWLALTLAALAWLHAAGTALFTAWLLGGLGHAPVAGPPPALHQPVWWVFSGALLAGMGWWWYQTASPSGRLHGSEVHRVARCWLACAFWAWPWEWLSKPGKPPPRCHRLPAGWPTSPTCPRCWTGRA